MVQEYFIVNGFNRMLEVKKFIREQMPSARFIHNPENVYDKKYSFDICYEIEDMNKLSNLLNRYFEEDNPKIVKESFIIRLKTFVKNSLKCFLFRFNCLYLHRKRYK